MAVISSKSALSVALSQLKGFSTPNVALEQYKTDPEIAADLLWIAYMQKDIEGKIIADFGSGTGILGIGALLLGAKVVIFVESESLAMKTAKENYSAAQTKYGFTGSARFVEGDITSFNESCDTVVENPPFGTKNKHADKAFLEHAMQTARTIYSLHKTTSRPFIAALSRDFGFRAIEAGTYHYPLSATMAHHSKKRVFIEVSLFQLKK